MVLAVLLALATAVAPVKDDPCAHHKPIVHRPVHRVVHRQVTVVDTIRLQTVALCPQPCPPKPRCFSPAAYSPCPQASYHDHGSILPWAILAGAVVAGVVLASQDHDHNVTVNTAASAQADFNRHPHRH